MLSFDRLRPGLGLLSRRPRQERPDVIGAGNEDRTHDIHLGKVALYR